MIIFWLGSDFAPLSLQLVKVDQKLICKNTFDTMYFMELAQGAWFLDFEFICEKRILYFYLNLAKFYWTILKLLKKEREIMLLCVAHIILFLLSHFWLPLKPKKMLQETDETAIEVKLVLKICLSNTFVEFHLLCTCPNPWYKK